MQDQDLTRPRTMDDGPTALPCSRWVDLGRVSLRYVISGPDNGESGPPVVLLHEMGGSLETWDLTFRHLARRHRLLAYDWRGAGHSEKILGEVTIDDHVGDLDALLHKVGWHEPVVLAGCAVGAAIAAAFAAAWPARAAGIVLFSPAMGIPSAHRVERERIIAQFERCGMRPSAETSLGGGYPERFRGEHARFADFRARWMANDPASFAAIYRMLLRLDMEPALKGITCPVLAVGGEYDPVRTPDYVQGIARSIPNATFMTAPGGHHMPHQIPLQVASVIENFVEGLKPGGRDVDVD